MPHTGHSFDHVGDPGQGPHVGGEAVGLRPSQQRRLHLFDLLIGQPSPASQPRRADQRLPATGPPLVVPPRRGLRRDTQRIDHIDLPAAGLEHVHSPHPLLPQRIHVANDTTTRTG
ncbi:hypothetical protein GCM10027610_057240 [Dactylosporangium cerinum]